MKSVVITGSRRFKKKIFAFADKLRKSGVVVFPPILHDDEKAFNQLPKEYQKLVCTGLTHDHFQKIRQADIMYVFDPSGYTGKSSTLEIGFAAALGKLIIARCPDQDPCISILYQEIVPTAKGLLKFL